MPIIKAAKTTETEKIKFNINSGLAREIEKYCEWVVVKDVGVFFEQAAEFVLNKDKEWKRHNKSKYKST